MTVLFTTHPCWIWLILSGLLLIIEILGTNGYLLWSSVAALTVGLICSVFHLSLEIQGVLFALFNLISVFLWYFWLIQQHRKKQDIILNQRALQMKGTSLTLTQDLINGLGYARVGDGIWRIQADIDLSAGTQVKIIGVEGITLRISPKEIHQLSSTSTSTPPLKVEQ